MATLSEVCDPEPMLVADGDPAVVRHTAITRLVAPACAAELHPRFKPIDGRPRERRFPGVPRDFVHPIQLVDRRSKHEMRDLRIKLTTWPALFHAPIVRLVRSHQQVPLPPLVAPSARPRAARLHALVPSASPGWREVAAREGRGHARRAPARSKARRRSRSPRRTPQCQPFTARAKRALIAPWPCSARGSWRVDRARSRAQVRAPFRGAPRKALSRSRPRPGAHRTHRGVKHNPRLC